MLGYEGSFTIVQTRFYVCIDVISATIAVPDNNIIINYDYFTLKLPEEIEKQLELHKRYEPIVADSAMRVRRMADQEELVEKRSFFTRAYRSLVDVNRKEAKRKLEHMSKGVALCQLLKVASEAGMKLYADHEDLVAIIKRVDAHHDTIAKATDEWYEKQKENVKRFYL